MSAFSPKEINRYQRQLALAGFGPAAQKRLKAGRVLVIGAGGLGCPALLYLAAAGVGHITVVDPDRLEVSNLQRQVLYAGEDVGTAKATAAAAQLRVRNPHVAVTPLVGRFDRSNALALVAAHDVVLDGSDNFATRYLVNDACVLAGRPFVYGAIQGFEGQAGVFNWRGGPTYRCLFPEPPAPGTVPNCAEAGVLGVLPGLIGTVQATEVVKLLTGIGEPLSGRLLLWNALTMTLRTIRVAADPARRTIRELPPEEYGATCVPRPSALAEEIGPEELRAWLEHGSAPQLLDVREDWERGLGAILPSAHVPLGLLSTKTDTGPLAALDRQRPTVAFCAGGARSRKARELLQQVHGFTAVVSLRGGYRQWQESRA